MFEPFGELEFVDLHKDPVTGRSKGYAFVQYKRSEDARMALEQMDGFELAGRTVRISSDHGRYILLTCLSCVLTPFTRKETFVTRNKIHLTKRAVSLSPLFHYAVSETPLLL